MITSVIISYLPYALITTFTPGPNNLIAFYAVSTHGWKASRKVFAGIWLALTLIMVLAALFCNQLALLAPSFMKYFKFVGAAYILWLAYKIGTSGPDNSTFNITGFCKGFILVFVNVKMLLYALTVFTGYILPVTSALPVLLFHALLLSALCIASNLLWAAAGQSLRSFLNRHYRGFNIIMGLILAYCAISLLL